MSSNGAHRLANYFGGLNRGLGSVGTYHSCGMVFGASEYFLLSGDFGDWSFWLLDNISAVDESFIGLVMCGRIMVRYICGYP